jgi:hypothetical protein
MVNGEYTRALTFQNLYQEIEQLNDDLDRLTECNQNLSDQIATLKEEGGGGEGGGNGRGGADVQALKTQLEHARQVVPTPPRLPTRVPLPPSSAHALPPPTHECPTRFPLFLPS